MNKGLFSITLKLLVFVLTVSLLVPYQALAQSVGGDKVSGTVIDATGWPVIGAAILIKGTTTGSTTDIDGLFEFELPADLAEGAELEFSCLGFKHMTKF